MSAMLDPRERLERWLDEAIIGLDLCPFAAKARRAGGVRIALITVSNPIHAVHATLEEARALLSVDSKDAQTTLVVITEGLEDFCRSRAFTRTTGSMARRQTP